MQTALQIIFQVISAVLTVLAVIQKKKWKMMLLFILNNIFCILMYFAFSRIAAAVICIVATIRTTIIMIYSLKGKKLHFVWLIIFETAFIISAIVTWQDALDLMPLFAMLAVGYGTWQDNDAVLRITYIINMSLYSVYGFVIGAYIAMVVQLVDLVWTIISFIYYSILKKQTPLLQLIFHKKQKLKQNETEQVFEEQ